VIYRKHTAKGIKRSVWLSDCEHYRHRLRAEWDDTKPLLAFMMLNPSTASHLVDDATFRLCIGRAQRLDYGAVELVNTHDLRATHPRELFITLHPSSTDNFDCVIDTAQRAELVVCAWGTHPLADTQYWLKQFYLFHLDWKLRHLGLTKGGHPRHPLRVAYSVPLQEF
jgi:hypothetical protein